MFKIWTLRNTLCYAGPPLHDRKCICLFVCSVDAMQKNISKLKQSHILLAMLCLLGVSECPVWYGVFGEGQPWWNIPARAIFKPATEKLLWLVPGKLKIKISDKAFPCQDVITNSWLYLCGTDLILSFGKTQSWHDWCWYDIINRLYMVRQSDVDRRIADRFRTYICTSLLPIPHNSRKFTCGYTLESCIKSSCLSTWSVVKRMNIRVYTKTIRTTWNPQGQSLVHCIRGWPRLLFGKGWRKWRQPSIDLSRNLVKSGVWNVWKWVRQYCLQHRYLRKRWLQWWHILLYLS